MSPFLSHASSFLSNTLWNSGSALVLGLAVFALSRLSAFQRRPALLHLLWFGILVRLAVPSVVPIPILPGSPVTIRVESQLTDALPQNLSVTIVPTSVQPREIPSMSTTAAATPSWNVLSLLLGLSLVGTGVLCLCCLYRLHRLRDLLRNAQAAPARLKILTKTAARTMGLTATPRLCMVDHLASPAVLMGYRRATILLPWHLVERLDDGQWSCILAHEIAHLVRRDHWFNISGSIVLMLHWWNPVAWWAWREMQAHQEASCDAMAISQTPRSRRRYAETLLEVVDSWNHHPVIQPQVVLSFGSRSLLTRRFEMIANSSVRPRVAALATAGLVALALTFFCLPVRAEKNAQTGKARNSLIAAADKAEQAASAAKTEQEIMELKEKSRNNLKNIMLAMHNYHDKHKRFPPAMLFGKDNQGGKFPHSWRVALLPFLDQGALYEQYQFDEAWDSPANKKVLAKIPYMYRDPAADMNSVDTAYVVLVGKLQDDDSRPEKLETIFSSRTGAQIRTIRDGTSNTLAVVETKREGKDAIAWTQPTDIEYIPGKDLPKLGGVYKEGFYAAIADGSVRLIPKDIPVGTLRELISPASGIPLPAF